MQSHKIKTFTNLVKIVSKHKKEGKKIVFAHGFFDIFHAGHANLLKKAKAYGDILVVGIDHDDNAKLFKGHKRPINKHNTRMFVVSCIEFVDYVFLVPSLKNVSNHEDAWLSIYKQLLPDIVATNVKVGRFGEHKRKYTKAVDAKFVDIDSAYENSTTKTIELLGL